MESEQLTEKWRTIGEFPDFVVSDRGRFAWKRGKHAGREKKVLSKTGYSKSGSRWHVRLSRKDGGEYIEYKRSASALFSKTWPQKPNPYA